MQSGGPLQAHLITPVRTHTQTHTHTDIAADRQQVSTDSDSLSVVHFTVQEGPLSLANDSVGAHIRISNLGF